VVTAVVTAEVEVVDVGITTAVEVIVVVPDVVGVVVDVFVVVDELQDANTIDVTTRRVNTIQRTPFFI